ncbi:Bromodomain and WD repeat-containing protein 3 [Gryganskiella cystojenkinii]|nr:Bromodomain and WD repeat-containing protein 3 [Gryganskiella cystojenkinii]
MNCIDPEHLPHLLSRLVVNTDAQIPPLVPGMRSLLSTGGNSLLRTPQEAERLRKKQGNTGGRSLQRVVFNGQGASRKTRTLEYIRARELRPRVVPIVRLPSFIPSLFEELVIMNGHRFPTFCVSFDKTGNRIITGSDDYLVKIWCAQSGYLLFTLRGHAAVVTYMDLSTDNTMLATASNDGIVRVWDLKTSAPIAVLPTGGTARTRKPITTVSFSPSPIPHIRYLIATSLDGYTWVWKFDKDTKKFHSPPVRLDCKTFNDSKLKCSTWNRTGSQFAVAGTDLFIRVFSTIQGGPEAIKAGKRRKSYDRARIAGLEGPHQEGSSSSSSATTNPPPKSTPATQDWGEPVLIAQLDGHVGVVTSLGYSRHGNRLLSGSVDGFVRIWKYDQQSKMWTSMAIDVRDEHIQAEATITAARHMLPSPVATSAPPNPLSAGSISTADNTQEDANNTDSEMNGSTTADPPAVNSNSAGESRTVPTPEDSRIIPTMAIWSLDDSAVVLTTSLGEIKIFNSWTGEWMHTLKGHVRGTSIYVVDVHPIDSRILMTAGYDGQVILWDIVKGVKIKSWTYAEHEFLDGRFSPDGLMFAVTDQEGKCILFGSGKNPDDYKDARMFVEQTFWSDYALVRYDADHNVVDDTTQIAPHLMERTPILDNNGRDYARQKGPRYGLDLPVEQPSGVLEQEEAAKMELLEQELENLAEQTLAILPTTDKKSLYKRRREFILEEDEDDDDPMTTEVPIVPLPNDSSGEEYAGGAASASSSSESEEEDSDLAPGDDSIPMRSMIDDDDDDDDEYFSGGGGSSSRKRRAASSNGTPRKRRAAGDRRRKTGRARKRARMLDDDDDDLLEDDEEEDDFSEESDEYDAPRTPRTPRKTSNGRSSNNRLPSGSKSQRSARPKSFANDDYPSDEIQEDSDDNIDDDDGFSGSSVGGSSSAMLPYDSTPSAPPSPKRKKQWRGNGRKKGKAVLRDEKTMELQRWLPSDWIRVNEPRKTPYHPQLGDHVAYLRQGHSMYLKETPLRQRLNLKVVPFTKDPNLPWVTFGRVSRITYNVGPPTWCTITLDEQILDSAYGYPPNPQFSPSRRRFEIEFHDLGDVPDFIILYSLFQEGINAQYSVGEQIWASFDGASYAGTISAQVVDDPALPDSHWMAFEVAWPMDETTNLSPWEMQREEEEESVNQDSIPDDEYARIHEILQHFLQMDEFQIFKSQVDFEAYPDYCKAVAYPLCLDAIQDRLANGYYRRARAVQFDIELLEKNALTFNDPKSDLALCAKHLTRIYKSSAMNPSKALPAAIHIKKTRRYEDDEFDGEGSENEQVDVDSEPELDPTEVEDIVDDDAEDDFLVSDDSEVGSTSSRSRAKKGASTRKTSRRSKATPLSPSSRSNGGSTRSRQSSGNARGKGKKKARGVSDDEDDDDDGEWGKPNSSNSSSSRGRNGGGAVASSSSSSRPRRGRAAAAARSINKRRGDSDDFEEEDGEEEAYVEEEEENAIEDEDEEEEEQDNPFAAPSAPLSRNNKRKKTKIIDSDDDFVS